MLFRRAEIKDIPQIKQLIKGGFGRDDMERALKRRYGDFNLHYLIDTCAISLVCINNDKIDGFLSLSVSPPTYLPPSNITLHDGDFVDWIKSNYKCQIAKVHNMAFVNFFCSTAEDQSVILQEAFTKIFNLVPSLDTICYFLPDQLILFPPFSSTRPPAKKNVDKLGHARIQKHKLSSHFFTEFPATNSCNFPYSLHGCQRKDFCPPFQIRKSTVEDCDDVVPILLKNNLMETKDSFVAKLLDNSDPTKLSLVGQINGDIVGFICLDSSIDEKLLIENFNLEMYNDLQKVSANQQDSLADLKNVEEQNTVKNAFCVTMFCIDSEYAQYSIQFIQYAFTIFEDLEYCAMTLSPEYPDTPLTRQCSLVPSIPPCQDRMYITNRYCGNTIDVCLASTQDVGNIYSLIENLENIDNLKQSVEAQFNEKTHKTYLAKYNKQIVGLIILQYINEEEGIGYLDQFDIDRFFDVKHKPIHDKYSVAKYMIMNPLFENHTRYFCREVMRQLNLNCILYPRNLNDMNDYASKRTAIREFVPVKPRRTVQYPNNLRDGLLLHAEIPINLQLITMPLIFEPRMVINTRIVVVGASDVGIAFLDNLIYIAIDYYANIIQGETEQLHRHEKNITLTDETILPYDYLILAPGLQYFAKELDPQLESLNGVICVDQTTKRGIDNALLIQKENFGKVVIFGSSLQAYATVQHCLDIGIEGSRIYFIEPRQTVELAEEKINEIISNQLRDAGVVHYQGYTYGQTQKLEGRLVGLTLMDKFNKKAIIGGVDLLLYADKKSVDPRMHKTINNAHLVFDGALVIDKHFRTTDQYIFGAGPITKYSINEKTEWSLSMYNSKEVGERLAWVLLHLFCPNLDPYTLCQRYEIHQFTDSVKKFAILPGNLKYFHFNKPVLPHFQVEPKCRDLEITKEDEFTNIHIDPNGYIQAFTYLGTRDIPISNLECLYSRHEKYFNRLIARFDEGVIPDFIPFFNENWALCMFHDRFPEFILASRTAGLLLEETSKIMSDLDQEKKLTEKKIQKYYNRFDKSADRQVWNDSVFEFMMNTRIFKTYP
ncbi:hypothetical protein HDV06_004022 [Boothiomyces sp. JEL0866]|nr:hypothetical protein HDV06_004022 [Boothiomyces sp. JEL0866]